MTKARYICFEGTEGVGKTTQVAKLSQYLLSKGYNTLTTKEPGTPLAPLTLVLRGVMLDKQYDAELTVEARELVSQAIRSIHLQNVIYPSLEKFTYIVQDRGILSGLAYGSACGVNLDRLNDLAKYATFGENNPGNLTISSHYELYDDIVYLKGNISEGLKKAQSSKQEFAAGDAIESKGVSFLNKAGSTMDQCAKLFKNVHVINVDGKSIDQVFDDILVALNIKGGTDDASQSQKEY